MVLRAGGTTVSVTMSKPGEKMLDSDVVRPRRITRPPSYLQDYEFGLAQTQHTFANEHASAVRNTDVISFIHEMREESKQLRQDVQRISEIITNLPVLDTPQVSPSLQPSPDAEFDRSAIPMAARRMSPPHYEQSSDQPELPPPVPPRDESLHVYNDSRQDLIEDLIHRLKETGRLSGAPIHSGQATPQYAEPPMVERKLMPYAIDRHNQSTPSNRLYDESNPLPNHFRQPPRDPCHPPADPYKYNSHSEYKPARNLSDPRYGHLTQTSHKPVMLEHSGPYFQRERRNNHYPDNERFYSTDMPYPTLHQEPNLPYQSMSVQYRGPTPTIPDFIHDDPREFNRLKLALDNVLPEDASESFKFQILMDHLKLEDALLIADSYSHGPSPFSDTMRALIDMYGQPHQLALQRISSLMDGPNIRSGDVRAFKGFALRVRALVGMLNQLGSPGWTELKCGSHVSRLLTKLPYDLRANFKRFINPLQTPIPTLLDLADWLEYEVRVQVEGTRYTTFLDREKFGLHKDKRPGFPARKPTTILHGRDQKEVLTGNFGTGSVPSGKTQEKPKKYCPFCDTINHYMNQCSNFKLLTKQQVENWIKMGHRCWRCGRSHPTSKCTLKAKCKQCERRHLEVLHDVNTNSDSSRTCNIRESHSSTDPVSSTSQTLYLDRPTSGKQVLLKLSRVVIRNGDRSLETYAVLDDGLERTILLHEAAQRLGLQGTIEDLALRTVRQEVHTIRGNSVSFTIAPASQPDRSFQVFGAFTAKGLGLVKHTYPITELQQKHGYLRDLPLHAINQAQPLVLIGSDYPHLITPVEPVILGSKGGPAAVHTRLGWTLQGPSRILCSQLQPQECFFVSCAKPDSELFNQVENLWKLDILPYRSDKVVTRSRQDAEAIRILEEKTVRINVEGVKRYATPLLWKESLPPLNAPKEAVLPLLRSAEKRLSKEPKLTNIYNTEIQKLQQAGYITLPTTEECGLSSHSWYIPHHIVHHNGKNRIVFNCSFEYQGQSLNENLLPGPTLGPSLLGVLLRFREHPIAVCSDVRGMFHQVRLLDEDKPFLKFLWRDGITSEPPTIYQWAVLPFGTTCSPCCAVFALQSHAGILESTDDVRQTVERNFYVDNCLKSISDVEQAKQLVNRLQNHLSEGGFELRQWASNDPTVIDHFPSELKSKGSEIWLSQGTTNPLEQTLGLIWNCQSDTLAYKPFQEDKGEITMRKIYRTLAKQYDPLGYLIPFTTRAKIIVQLLWNKKRGWDDPCLPADLLAAWEEWENELPHLAQITLPRCYSGIVQQPIKHRSVHIFCDASERAYGSVAYLSTEDDQQNTQIAFLAARSRVAPKRQLSIARLELCGALTGAQLGAVLKRELTQEIHHFVYWTDSTTVLAWLQSDSCRYKVFVGVRVSEIQELSDPGSWHYVDSSTNPADDITRGLTLTQLTQDNRWRQGPAFLTQPKCNWPKVPERQTPDEDSELRKLTFCGTLNETPVIPDVQQFSSYQELLDNTVKSLHGAAEKGQPPNANDYHDAELTLLRHCQMHDFPKEFALLKEGKPVPNSSQLSGLAPEYDQDSNLIRVGGRLRRCESLTKDILHPVVLNPTNPVVTLLIKHYDAKLLHSGPGRVYAELRRKFWILRGREAVKKHQRCCPECQKWRGRPVIPKMSDIPPSSLRLFKPPFYSTGVDCFGPLMIKIGRRTEKRWGIVYKCLTTRAVSLDLLDHMDTDSFLLSLRRFTARRGRPYELLSDQGTNFRGGNTELEEAFKEMQPLLRDQLAKEQIRFRFNPPSAPHFGGSWEREVRSVKTALRTTLGAQIVTEEVLRTVLVEVEGILNSRPLGYVSSDVADPDPVTPNSLLMGRPDSSLPQVVYPESDLLSRKRWRHSQILSDHFWKHFVHDFLPTLQARQKWKQERDNITVGTVVLIADEQLPRALWRVGTVSSIIPSPDGRVRTAVIKVKEHTYTRPVAKLIRLPALPQDTDVIQ
ncbi:uncharacterized protein [Danio rerio]|uniref:Uncharacterized protein n=1 Tax=Danio rerio TaxID=7955 RepID=A0AC58G3D1_DANRE